MCLVIASSPTFNKLLKFTPAAKSAASAGQPTLRFGCPLAKRYVSSWK